MRGKCIVITGAFGTLGSATARAAIAAGARVVLTDVAAKVPAELSTELAASAVFLPGVDLADAGAAERAINSAKDQLQGMDVLINTAGSFRWQMLEDGDPAVWDMQFNSNLKSTVNACRAAIPHMRARGAGRIVNVGALAAINAGAGMGAYTASKSGVHRLTESLAMELMGQGIAVNAVLPSIIDTPANRRDMPGADFSTWVSPQSLAEVIMFLASDAARDINGALLPVRGRI